MQSDAVDAGTIDSSVFGSSQEVCGLIPPVLAAFVRTIVPASQKATGERLTLKARDAIGPRYGREALGLRDTHPGRLRAKAALARFLRWGCWTVRQPADSNTQNFLFPLAEPVEATEPEDYCAKLAIPYILRLYSAPGFRWGHYSLRGLESIT